MRNIQITVVLIEKQIKKLKKHSEETGNSRNSIIRTAINEYFQKNPYKNLRG